jgi:hypothetical protein
MPQTTGDTLSHLHNYTSYLLLLFITLTLYWGQEAFMFHFTIKSIYIWIQCDTISLWSALLWWNCLTMVKEQGAN